MNYSRDSHINRTPSASPASPNKAKAEAVFIPRKHPADEFPTRQYVEDQAIYWENRIEQQRKARLEREQINPATKLQRKQTRRRLPATI